MIEIINKKKNKEQLTEEEINFFINNLNEIEDYQISALLMAITINGMTDEETSYLTKAMANSGEKMQNEDAVDKHSTGGVGDKVSLIIGPILASLNIKVAKMSGRGLGYTGGTIDKLESININTTLTEQQFNKQINDINISIISQTKNIAPADKKLYHLRDVTATVESIPLITASIMSKKIASGAKNLVLDVKVGNGAFMKNIKDAKELANNMVNISKLCHINTVAVITNMNHPLGKNIGNTLEIQEVIEVLNGKEGSITTVSKTIAAHMISIYKKISYEEAYKLTEETIISKNAYEKFIEFVTYQGGNLNIKEAKYKKEIYATKEGYINYIAIEIGKLSSKLGAGRISYEDKIDYEAGIVLNYETNEYVKENDLIATLYSNSIITEDFNNCFKIEEKIDYKLIYEIIK